MGPRTPIQRLGNRLWPSCKRPHGPAVAKPLWRTLSEDDAIPADSVAVGGAAVATIHSEGERSPLPGGGHDGSDSSDCGIFDSTLSGERDLVPVAAARPQLSDRRLRQGVEGGDGGGGGDGRYEELNSTSVGLDYVNEVFGGVTSSVESSDDVQMYTASLSPAGAGSAAGSGSSTSTPSCRDSGHPQGNVSGIRRKMRMASSSRGGAAAAAAAAAAVAAEKSKSLRTFSVDTESAPSNSLHGGILFSSRQREFYSSEDSHHSTSSINTLAASTTGGRRMSTRGEPPGRMERVPSPRTSRFVADDMGDVLGRGGHVKTIQRIRSTGGLSNYPTFLAQASGNDGGGGGSGGGGGGDGARTPQRGSFNQEGYRPMVMTPTTMTAGLKGAGTVTEARGREAEDVPEDIDTNLKRGEGSPLAPYEGGESMALANPVVCRTRSSELSSGRDQRSWGARPLSAIDSLDSCTGSGGLGGLSLDVGSIHGQGFGDMEQSYDLSEDGGTLKMHGFVLKPDGMKSTPTPSNAGESHSR